MKIPEITTKAPIKVNIPGIYSCPTRQLIICPINGSSNNAFATIWGSKYLSENNCPPFPQNPQKGAMRNAEIYICSLESHPKSP